jgi:glycosyltransferase involved in cell wall biosynthesis
MLKIGIECESIEDSQSWGVARELNNLLKQIASRPELEKEFKFFLYFKSHIPDYEFLKNPIFVKKIVWPPLGSFSFYYYVFLPIKLWFERLDVVYFPNYMLPILFCGKSLVSLTEDVFHEINNPEMSFRYRAAYKIFATWAAQHATRIMAFSESSKKAVSKLFKIPFERISANYHGIDIRPVTGKNIPFENFGLYVAQAFPRRHLKETLLAFEKISSKYPDLKFIAIGKDKYNPPIIDNLVKEINSRLGDEKIIYKEYVDENELIGLFRNAKFIMYVSESEAFGLPPLEGLGYGTIPVVADAPINKEIYGENAFFVESPITVGSIARSMEDSLNNEEKIEKIKNSITGIINKFSWSDHTDRFLKIIRKIINEKN